MHSPRAGAAHPRRTPDRGVHGGKWVLYGRERPYIQCVSKKVATLKLFAKIFT